MRVKNDSTVLIKKLENRAFLQANDPAAWGNI